MSRLTKGYTDEGKQIYSYIGYYERKEDALIALSFYNNNHYDIEKCKVTFLELYDKWSKEHYPKISDTSIDHYQRAFRYCKDLHDLRFVDIRVTHLQRCYR